MRSPTAIATHGTGKSRSKPLYRRSLKNVMIQHRGYIKIMRFYDAMIKKTAPVKKVHMKKLNFAIKKAFHFGKK